MHNSNSNVSLKFDFLHGKYGSIQGQHNNGKVKSTGNWHYFELQMHGILHLYQKERCESLPIIHCHVKYYIVQ